MSQFIPGALQKILNCPSHALASDSRPTSSYIHNTQKCLVLRNSLTSLSPFPFKTCSERIIDFHFLALTKFSDKNFDCHFTLLACCNCGQGAKRRDWELVKQQNNFPNFSKQGTRQIEFSDAFKTKIGSFPVRAGKRSWAACGYRRIFKFQTFACLHADSFSLLVASWEQTYRSVKTNTPNQ